MLDIDQTWQVGRFYIDFCGVIPSKSLSLGVDVEWSGDPCWGRRVSLHIIWLCVTFGLEGTGHAL